ncbi:DEAD/DEAH box helicase [Kibdelosporangium philippinense]|uniref:DEAD/DEAH box helicase n=1 Tax=Kibdelosporangium philippinense TaxID=211113 RepID=A0ABS8ZBT6_9PSEU|nr:DEAD/DEAH box helicase [Kibdelosporangium philippinense]MCE7003993.1 DEAD/DEAH box helicase [Kibdelosporangium philippinense]
MIEFEPADPPRASQFVFRDSDGDVRVPVGAALPTLLRDAQWGPRAQRALRLVAAGKIVPAISPAGYDTWRIDGEGDEFDNAVADTLPRTPAALLVLGGQAFAASEPQQMQHGSLDATVRVALRLTIDLDTAQFLATLDFPGEWNAATMLAVRRATPAWPVLERFLDDTEPGTLLLGDPEIGELLGGAIQRLHDAGIDVRWPSEVARSLAARAVISGGPGGEVDLNWQVTLGGQALSDAEIEVLADAHRPLVRLRDQWLLVDPTLARHARDRTLKPMPTLEALGAALTGTAHIDGHDVPAIATGWLESLRQRISDPAEDDVAQPAALTATLRDYQLRGLRWLDRMTSLGLGGCLADDMGLGKTITLIALHLRRGSKPTLVVCPASLLGNWEREITKFAPGTPVRRFHGSARNLDDLDGGFVLTTYSTMRLDAETLARHEWDLLVADEAQHVKNPGSGTAKALRTIPSAARVALTGTPVENNLSELWAILDWTTPGLLGPLAAFRTRWDGNPTGLAPLVRPFLLRRRKSDPGIAPELPPKTETDRPVPLTREQAGLYQALVDEVMAQIKASSGIARRGLIMKLLTGLKQICNHPAQFLKEPKAQLPGRSGKLELLDELLATILAEDGSVLVFTQYVTMARLLERHLRDHGVTTQLLHGGTPVPAREDMVRRFQNGEAPVFLLSLKAAGTGLNLTRADHVVHYDRWWNPAVEDQASDRASRIGQTRPVQVHRLIAEGTLEDRIAEMLREKKKLADAVLGTGEAALTELSDADLAELIELRGTW